MTDYKLIRSNRKTVSLQVKDGQAIVRAPMKMSVRDIDAFVLKNSDWLKKQLEKSRARAAARERIPKLTEQEMKKLTQYAKSYLPQRVAYYAPIVGVTYNKITIRHQKTRWGSCSSKGNLNFNCMLMLTTPEVIDSVVVHELCHRKEMNHSKKFYAHLLRVYPEYSKCRKWLKENGRAILDRMP